MPAQPTCTLAVQGRGGNPRYVIQNHLQGLPEVGDSSLIRGNAPASAKRLVKNVFDAYGVGTEGCFAGSVGESVRLVEVNVKGYHQCSEQVEPKEKLEASTVTEVTVSPGTSRWIIGPHSLTLVGMVEMLNGAGILHGGCIAYLIDMYAPSANHSWTMTVISVYVSIAVAVLPWSYSVMSKGRTVLG
jgi:hypothetical protein